MATSTQLVLADPTSDEQEWRALDVDLVDEESLFWETTDSATQGLPTCTVKRSIKDLSRVAVVSWRWDGDLKDPAKGSRNIYSAIRYAKSAGIRFLFIDIISIDQSLEPHRLLPEVVAFSKLYETIPAICAYDCEGAKPSTTMLRPWIVSEMRSLAKNQSQIVYVGHSNNESWGSDEYSLSPGRIQFMWGITKSWEACFRDSICGVLSGDVGMHSTADLKYLMPELAPILTVAHSQMPEEDYLLTAAILSHLYYTPRNENGSLYPFETYPFPLGTKTILNMDYRRYSLRAHESSIQRVHEKEIDIFLDGVNLGALSTFDPDTMFYDPREMQHMLEAAKAQAAMKGNVTAFSNALFKADKWQCQLNYDAERCIISALEIPDCESIPQRFGPSYENRSIVFSNVKYFGVDNISRRVP